MATGESGYRADLYELQRILWGPHSATETFRRWSQGFVFSEVESTALVQCAGGPCAILAPIQAYMLKHIISSYKPDDSLKMNKREQEGLLIIAMVEILMQCIRRNVGPSMLTVVARSHNSSNENATRRNQSIPSTSTYPDPTTPVDAAGNPIFAPLDLTEVTSEEIVVTTTGEPMITDDRTSPVKSMVVDSGGGACVAVGSVKMVSEQDCMESVESPVCLNPSKDSCSESDLLSEPKSPLPEIDKGDYKAANIVETSKESMTLSSDPSEINSQSVVREIELNSVDLFHDNLVIFRLQTQKDVEQFLREQIEHFCGDYGLLLFLYSVLLTKGVQELKSEIGDLSEPLIHEIYGYGSQSLVNLMLTGRAVQHVWDNDQDVGGLTLKGIDRPSDIGFVTLMEHMRYCTVGMFLKNPKYPIWVLGSETHLTVAFSFDTRLALPEQPWETARRIFRRYDPDGSNFIQYTSLPLLLKDLGLVSDPEYVEIMRQKLDSENLGIVLLTSFLDEFYPDMKSLVPETFTIWHYNGLCGSHYNNVVQYVKGNAVLLESDIKSGSESDQVLTCLQTKWPNIELQWETPNLKPPSLN